jgi:ABC-type transporter Mla subunit MlaD
MNSSRVKYEESLLKIENFQAIISGYQSERNRFMASYKDQQNKLEQLAAQNRAFHKSSDPKTIDLLKSNISSLQRLLHQTQQDKDKAQEDFNSKLSSIQREVSMEKERADSVLTQSLREREEVEARWQERWSKHHSKLNDQLEILKTNYEGSLKSSKEREEALQSEISSLQEKLSNYNRKWEEYREKIQQELLHWKLRVEELEQELLNTQKGKVDVEVMFQEKTIQLEELHEALRQGVEERQELQRRNESLERSIQESVFSNSQGSLNLNFDFNSSNPPKNPGAFNSPTAVEDLREENSAEIENALLWKQSQNLGTVQKETNSKKSSPRQQQQKHQQSKSEHRQRPTSPFPVPSGGKSFGKNLKTTSTGNVNISKDKDLKKNNTSKNKNNSDSNNSMPMVFSVAAPNPSRKSHRK